MKKRLPLFLACFLILVAFMTLLPSPQTASIAAARVSPRAAPAAESLGTLGQTERPSALRSAAPLSTVSAAPSGSPSPMVYVTLTATLASPGSDWRCYPSGGACGYYLFSVYMISPSEGWAVGAGGAIMHFMSGQWMPVASPTTEKLNSIYMLSSSEGWAVGDNGTILHYTGGNWQKDPSLGYNQLLSLYMVSASEGWAVGYGTIVHFTDGTWNVVASPTSGSLRSVTCCLPTRAGPWVMAARSFII